MWVFQVSSNGIVRIRETRVILLEWFVAEDDYCSITFLIIVDVMFIQPEALSGQTGSDFFFHPCHISTQVQLALIITYASPITEPSIHTRLFIHV